MRISLIAWFLLAVAVAPAQEIAFKLPEKDLIPEGITFDPRSERFFMGSMYKKKVVQIKLDGTVSDFIPPDPEGLGQPLGMTVDVNRKHLWVCSTQGENVTGGRVSVSKYDLNTATCLKRYDLQVEGEIHLFNDLVVLADGTAYVTDSNHGAIYKIDPAEGAPELFVQSGQLGYANGITQSPDGKKLIVSGESGLITIDIATRRISRVQTQGYLVIADGLYRYNQSLIAIQNVFFPISIAQFDMNAEFSAVGNQKVLAVDLPQFDIPTTGVVVGDWFYFIANSQLLQLEKGAIKNPQALMDVIIMKVKLN